MIGEGTIREVTEPQEKDDALNHVMHHYSGRRWEFDEGMVADTRAWKITIDSLTGKRSG